MCGIAGIIGSFSKASGEALVKKMLKTIEHRGPDSNGLWSVDGFAFGMQRLSIIDLAGGDQPIWSNDGVGIVFNGEIYNFKKIRATLEEQGVVFKTHSDTEVILELYLKKGIQAVQDLEGMFGICLYDPGHQKVYLVRDRLGVKPLYYYQDEGQFIFCSEVKGIVAALQNKPDINQQAVWDYLTLRYVPSPDTVWKGIHKLEPAHYLEFDLGKHQATIRSYWKVAFLSSKKGDKNYEKEFEDLFLQAVEKRLLASDVPVGILLSGGLDSSCVAAAAIELGHKNFHTFSIGFEEGGDFNELKYAEQVAKYIGSEHHTITINQHEFLDFIPHFVRFTDEPLADLASIPFYYVSKLAHEKVKVVLSGEGSDEILAGYNLDELSKKLFFLKIANHLPDFVLKKLPKTSLNILGDHGISGYLKSQSVHMTNVFSEEEKQRLCSFSVPYKTSKKIQDWYHLTSSQEPLDQLQQVYCHSWLVEDLLMKADKMSMATSLEVRVPFLDHKLVEWAAKLPLEWKVGNVTSGFTTKKILRNFAKKRIPQTIIDRPKLGFPVPAYGWIQKDLHPWALQSMESSNIFDFVKKLEVDRIMQDTRKGSLQAAHQAWVLVIFSQWLKQWNA